MLGFSTDKVTFNMCSILAVKHIRDFYGMSATIYWHC